MVRIDLKQAVASINGPGAGGPNGARCKNGRGVPCGLDLERQTNLTTNQLQVWLGQMLLPEAPVYNLAGALTIFGEIHPGHFEEAFQELVNSSDALRTVIEEDDGIPFQRTLPQRPCRLEIVDVSAFPDPRRQAKRWMRERCRLPLSWQRLFDAALIRVSPRESIWYLSVHHIVCDGWSFELICRRMSDLYARSLEGKPPSRARPGGFADYVAYERAYRFSSRYREAERYWERKLADRGEPLCFYGSLPLGGTTRVRRVSRRLGRERTRKLESIAAAIVGGTRDASLSAALAGVLIAYLHCLNGRESYTVGIPFHNRRPRLFKETIGFFSEVLPVRIHLTGNETFAALVRKVMEEMLQAARHGQHAIANPVFRKHYEVTFNYHRSSFTEFAGMRAFPQWVHSGHGEESLALQAHDFEGSGNLRLDFDFHQVIFDKRQCADALRHFLAVLNAFLADPERPLSRLSLLSEEEGRRVVAVWSRGAEVAEGRCVHELIERQAKESPEAVAVIHRDQKITYGELDLRANRLARYLQKRGAGPGILVGLHVEPSLEMVVGLLGILKAGAAYVPLDPEYPYEWLIQVLEETQTDLVLTQAKFLDGLPRGRHASLALDCEAEEIMRESDRPVTSGVTLDHLAYVIYTSGSAGTPKGVAVPHGAVANFSVQATQIFELTPEDRVLQLASISFDTSVEEIFPCLASGATLVLQDEPVLQAPPAFLQWCRERHVSVIDLPTAYWHELTLQLYSDQLALPESLRLVIIGGERAIPERLALWQSYVGERPRLLNTYGPTETTVAATVRDLTGLPVSCGSGRAVPIGKPIANLQTYVLDKNLRPVPAGVPGELYIGGAGLARGYLSRPELTAESFVPNPFGGPPGSRLYRTGDLVRYLPDGDLEFLGRIDRQVKVRGFRVELDGVEAAMRRHPLIREVAVVPEGGPNPKALLACVVPQKGAFLNGDELREFAKKNLPEYMVPATFRVMGSLPLTSTGKVDYRALQALERRDAERKSFSLPETETERRVASIWRQLLTLSEISRDDHFFELGGHSLLAAQLVSRLKREFNLEIPLRVVFDSPTLAALAQRVEELLRAEGRVARPAPPRLAQPTSALPLSFSQARIWFMHQLAPESSAYNIAAPVRFTGSLNKKALRRSLEVLVERHESLRTNLRRDGTEPVQVVGPAQPLAFPEIDLTGVPVDSRPMQARRVLVEEARRPFDLEWGPLFRVLLVRLAREDHVLLLTMHHAVSDQWSLGVIARELTSLYNGFCRTASFSLEPPAAQYADFALWQSQWLAPERVQEELAYWKRRLEGVEPLAIPTDRPRPAVQSFRGAYHSRELPGAVVGKLRKLGVATHATLYMAFLAAFKLLLRRYTGQTDIAIGAPVANRNRIEWEGVIGTFINILVLRTDLSGQCTFREALARVREVTLEAFAHQDLPFERLVEALQPERDPSRAPLVQVLFNFQHPPSGKGDLLGLSWAPFEIDQWAAQFDLVVTVDPEVTGKVFVSYNTDLYEAATIERLTSHYLRVLEAVAEDPDRSVGEIPLLTEDERQRLLVEWNSTAVAVPGLCAHELFEAQAKQRPEAVAVLCAGRALTYRQLNERANQLARRLRRMGVKPEMRVGICLERSPDLLVGLLGILKAGGAYVPIDPAYPAERKAFIFEDSGIEILVTESGLLSELPLSFFRPVLVDRLQESPESETADLQPTAEPGHLAYVIYTSGSTGQPKGVEIEHRALANFLQSMRRRPGMSSDDLLLSVTTISFDIAALELLLPLTVGARVALVSRKVAMNGVELAREIERLRPTVMQATPATWRMLLEASWGGSKGLKILCGGEALTADLAKALLDRGASVWNLYGPTETTVWSTVGEVDGRSAAIPIGRPIDNTRIYVLDENLEPVPVGVTGELYIGGYGVARGYSGRPELTAEKFVPDPFRPSARLFRTGDLARYVPDGNLVWSGRADHQIKIRGYRIEPREIELALERHGSVKQAVVLARRAEENPKSATQNPKSLDERLVAYIVAKSARTPGTEELRAHLAQKLPAFMVPADFVFVDAIPLTPNGKVNRGALPAPSGARLRDKKTLIAPRNNLEAQLRQVWQRTLGVRPIGVRDNFFHLGGHSLLAARLIAEVEKRFQTSVSLNAFLADPTIEGLAALLVNRNGGSLEWSSLIPLQPSGLRPPFFWIHGGESNLILPKTLGMEQPVYGFMHQYGDGRPARYTRVETIAEHYLDELRSVQPEGPYFLGGYSFGGLVAFEMAKQIEGSGDRVAFLALLEPTLPGGALSAPVSTGSSGFYAALSAFGFWFRRHRVALSSMCLQDKVAYLSERLKGVVEMTASRLERRLKKVAWQAFFRLGKPLPPALRGAYLLDLYSRAARVYRAAPYSGPTMIFCGGRWSQKVLPGWRGILGSVEVEIIEGDHGEIAREPNTALWASTLKARLQSAQDVGCEKVVAAAHPTRDNRNCH